MRTDLRRGMIRPVTLDTNEICLEAAPVGVGVNYVANTPVVLSEIIDAFAAPGDSRILIPALATGLQFVVSIIRAIIVERTGTITGTPTWKSGTNGAHDNFSPLHAVPSAGQLSLANPGNHVSFTIGPLAGTTNVLGAPDVSVPTMVELLTAATGAGATLKFRLGVFGFFVALP